MDRPEPTLKELRQGIEAEVSRVGVAPYSHNIISLSLRVIARRWGRRSANKAVRDFGLENLGWHQKLD